MPSIRPMVFAVGFGALAIGVGFKMGAFPQFGEDDGGNIPKQVEKLRIGMTVDEVRAVGGLPYNPPTTIEFQRRGQDPLMLESRFDDGKLARLKIETVFSNADGKKIGPTELAALLPALVEAKALRRPLNTEQVADALGRGRVVARVLDRDLGEVEVQRWTVEGAGSYEASFAKGVMVDHSFPAR